jgi:hypothetical protein
MRLASSTIAILIKMLKITGQNASALYGAKNDWIMAATIKETIPARKDIKNHGRVIWGFLDLSQKKTIIAGRVAVNNKSRRTQIPFILLLYCMVE